FNLSVLTAESTAVANWNALKAGMRPAAISLEAWDPIWDNFTSQAGTTWGQFVALLDENATYLGRLGLRPLAVARLLAFLFQQADALSLASNQESVVDVLL